MTAVHVHHPAGARPPARRAWQTHSWRPARLTGPDTVSLTSVLIAIALLYGGDYLSGDDLRTTTLTHIERAFPLYVWAGLILFGAAVLGAGIAARIHSAVWIGHGILAALYTGLVLGALQAAISSPALDGIRSAGLLALPVTIHVVLAVRTGPRPLAPTQAQPSELVVGGAGRPGEQ